MTILSRKDEIVDAIETTIIGRVSGAFTGIHRRAYGQGGARAWERFLDQDFTKAKRVIHTNITGTIYLIQQVGRDMRARRQGRILVVGSIGGFMPWRPSPDTPIQSNSAVST